MADLCKGTAHLLNPHLPFVEVRGADLRAFIARPEEGRAEMRRLLSKYGLVVFREAKLTPREEVQLNELPGYHKEVEVEVSHSGFNTDRVATVPGEPAVLCQGTALLENHHGITHLQLTQLLTLENEGFHSDGMHNQQEDLPVVTSMYCIKAPISGGETLFSCGRLALEKVDGETRALCRRLSVVHEYEEGGGLAIMREGIVREGRSSFSYEGAAVPKVRAPIVHMVHPLVRVHPETGEESVYVSCANIHHMEAPVGEGGEQAVHLDTAASYELVERVMGTVVRPPYLYPHQWQMDDLAIWDNRLTNHAPGKPETCLGERLHHRVRLGGSAAANVDLAKHHASRSVEEPTA